MSEAADPGAAGARHGRRARQLLQRYLVVFGPIHGVERADGAGVAPDPLAQLVVDSRLRADVIDRSLLILGRSHARTRPIVADTRPIARTYSADRC